MRPLLSIALLASLSACSGRSAEEPAKPNTDPSAPTEVALGTAPPLTLEPPAKATPPVVQPAAEPKNNAMNTSSELATFGAGCFWCVEAVLEQLPGVLDVASGYMGGNVPNPTYDQVCEGDTGHAEVVHVTFDPSKISYSTLLDWFFKLHDPTTLNRQGGDVGTQYRSAIFWHSPAQRDAAKQKIEALTAAKTFSRPIVTEVTQASTYYPAETYHQDYYRRNKTQNAYCRGVITPKLDKLGLPK